MRMLFAAGMMAMGLALGACDNPPIHPYQAQDLPSQVLLTDWTLQQDIRVSPPVVSYIGAQQMQVSVQLYNNTDHTIPVDYKYTFVDKNGAAIDPASGWQLVTVPPRSFQPFKFTSIAEAPKDFQVQLRPHQ